MRTFCDTQYVMKQAEIDLSGAVTGEVEFRIKQNPHLTYFAAKSESEKCAAEFAARLVWC